MKKRIKLALAVLCLAVFALSGCGGQPAGNAGEPEVIAVETARVSLDEIEIADYITGVIVPSLEVNIVPKMGGKVAEVAVQAGDRVKTGDLLVRLDTTEIAAQVKQAEAALAAAKGSIALAEANFNSAKDNMERMEYLYQQGGISGQQYQGAKTGLEVAQAQLNNAKDGSVGQAQAALELVRTQLNNALITAPSGGLAAGVYVEPGEMAGPTGPVVTIVELDPVLAQFNFTEGQIGLAKKGTSMEVKVGAAGEDKFPGQVSEISLVADPRTKAFTVKVALPNKEQAILPGMTAEVQLTLDRSTKNLIVPVTALAELDGKSHLYVVEDDVAVLKEIQVVLENETHAAVQGSLQAGDEVVIVGKEQLKDQARVKVVNRGDK